jgi:hypothetical protein
MVELLKDEAAMENLLCLILAVGVVMYACIYAWKGQGDDD